MEYQTPRTQYQRASRTLDMLWTTEALTNFMQNADQTHEKTQFYLKMIKQLHEKYKNIVENKQLIKPLNHELLLIKEARSYKKLILTNYETTMTKFEKELMDLVKEHALNAKKTEYISRMIWEINEAEENKWYPVFVTLTVAPQHYETVFKRNSNAWKEYARTVKRQIGYKLGLTKKEADAQDIHRYFTVVERGDKTGRLHLHVLHLCKTLPIDIVDPNANKQIPTNRCMLRWQSLWEYGYVTAIPLRTKSNDIYAQHGWNWPVEKHGTKINVHRTPGPNAIALYIGKYIHKQRYNKGDYWRCKMTRNFGLRKITKKIQHLPTQTLHHLATAKIIRPTPYKNRNIPTHILKRLATKTLLQRDPIQMVQEWKDLAPAPSLISQMRTMFMLTQISEKGDTFKWNKPLFHQNPLKKATSGLPKASLQPA